MTRLWQVPPHNPLLAVHQVWHGPADLEDSAKAILLLELASDRNRQAIADDQIILVDIALESSGDSTTIRRVVWTRRFMTRPSFLHLLSVQEFCSSPVAECHVEKNKVTWHKQDTLSREFRSGDYVRLLVRGPTTMTPAEVQVVLCEQEGADAQRYLYTRSPSHSPEPSAHSPEGAESEVEIYQDSPVENLTSTQRQDDEGTFQASSKTMPTHLRAPLQDCTNIKGKTSRWENFEDIHSQGHQLAQCRPGFKPHVSHRWCASHGLDIEEIGIPVKSVPQVLVLDELIPKKALPQANQPSPVPQPGDGLSRGGHKAVFHTSETASPQLDATLQSPNADKLTSCSVPGLQALTSKILARQPDLDQVFPNLEALDQALCDQIPPAFDRANRRCFSALKAVGIY